MPYYEPAPQAMPIDFPTTMQVEGRLFSVGFMTGRTVYNVDASPAVLEFELPNLSTFNFLLRSDTQNPQGNLHQNGTLFICARPMIPADNNFTSGDFVNQTSFAIQMELLASVADDFCMGGYLGACSVANAATFNIGPGYSGNWRDELGLVPESIAYT